MRWRQCQRRHGVAIDNLPAVPSPPNSKGTRIPSKVSSFQPRRGASVKPDLRSVITEKENECLFSEIVGAECLHHFANTVVQRCDHCGVGSSVWIADVCNTVEITLRSLIGAVWSVVGQIEEKRLCRMAINKRHRLAR